MKSPCASVDRVVLIANPKSKQGGRQAARRLTADLAEHFPDLPVQTLLTKRAGHATVLAKRAAARPGTLIVSISGDGGYNEVLNGAVTSSRSAPLCTVHGAGNANDHYSEVQEEAGLIDLLTNGQIVPMSVLEVTWRKRGKPITRYAHSYIGFGITARVAARLNQSGKSPASEASLVLRGLINHRPLSANLGRGMRSYDVLLVFNVGRMAKYLKVRGAAAEDRRFSVVALPAAPWWKWPLRVIKAIGPGLHPDTRAQQRVFSFPDAVEMQLDGEVFECDPDTEVSIRSRPGIVRTLRPSAS